MIKLIVKGTTKFIDSFDMLEFLSKANSTSPRKLKPFTAIVDLVDIANSAIPDQLPPL